MRQHRRLLTAVALTALLLLPSVPSGYAQGTGVVDGQVVNGTAGGPVPSDLTVTLHVIHDRNKVGERTVQTDSNGRFHLDGLDTATSLLYFPIVDYKGVGYYPAQPISLADGAPGQVTIQVFEASSSPEGLAFDRANMLIMNVTPTALTIMEMGAVVNASDRTFAPDPQTTGSDRTLRFSLPPGAQSITPRAGLPADTLDTTPDGFATTDPVKPGRRELAFSYDLPYDQATLDLTHTFTLPVGAFTIYVPDRGIDLVGPGLVAQGSADFGGQRFRQYAAQNLGAGTEIRFRLTNLPAPIFARPRDLGLAVVGVGGVLLAVMVFVAVRRRRAGVAHALPDVEDDDDPAEEIEDERERLVQSLAELDERFAAGGVSDDDYRTAREDGKARLLALAGASPRLES